MNLDFALLAERAELSNDRFFIHGGGWVAVQVPGLPWPVSMALVARFVGERTDAGERRTLVVTLEVPEEEDQMVLGAFPIQLADDPPAESQLLVANWILEVNNFPAPREGWYRFHLALEDVPVSALAFRVIQVSHESGLVPDQP